MLFGYNTNGFAHHRLEDAVAILADLGYRSVALTLDYYALNPYDDDYGTQLRRIDGLLQKYDLHSVIETGARFLLDPHRKHQPTLLSANANERQQRLAFLQYAIECAQELNSDAVSFWSGRPTDDASDDVLMMRLVSSCRELSDCAERCGVKLAFEPEPGMFIDTMPRFAELHQRVWHRYFGLTLDIGHLHCQGELPIADHVRQWKDWLWNVHIEDMRRGVHDHLMFGEGEINFREVMTALREIDYRWGVHVELSRHSHDAVETARRSLAFLRPLVGM